MHILDVLKERGFIAQVTFEEELYQQLETPTTELTRAQLEEDGRLTTLLALVGLAKSRGAARKLVEQNAVRMGEEKVTDVEYRLSPDAIPADGLLLRVGKKSYHRLVLK